MKLSILFYPRLDRVTKKGIYPIVCRVTLDGDRKVFNTGFKVSKLYWNQKRQKCSNRSDHALHINTGINHIRVKIESSFFSLMKQATPFTMEDLLNRGRRKKEHQNTLIIDYYESYLINMKRLVPSKYTLQTYYTVRQAYNYLCDYLKQKKMNSMKLSSMNKSFIASLRDQLTIKEYKSSTINKALKNILMVYNKAHADGVIKDHKLRGFRLKHEKREIKYLSAEDLTKLENYLPTKSNLSDIKDCFLFSCYTGMAYNELKNFSLDDIYADNNNQKWIKIFRTKTKKEYQIPLLPKAASIVQKLVNKNLSKLPIISNQKFNKYLKILAANALLKDAKSLTVHIGRKTFATTVCLSNGVSMEVVSRLLGHTSMKVTQEFYTVFTNRMILNSMKNILDQ